MTTEALPPHRVVNGEIVPLTAEEITELEAEWAAAASLPPPVPVQITARQFFIQLAMSGVISPEEALAAAQSRTVPAAIDAVFDTLDPQTALAARITWATMTTVPRTDPLFAAVGPALSMTEEDLDNFFRQAAAIP